MSRDLARRLEKLEAASAARRGAALHVVSDIADGDGPSGFLAKHGRFKTEAEMEAEAAALFASGRARPGERVLRLCHVIVDPPADRGPRRHGSARTPTPLH